MLIKEVVRLLSDVAQQADVVGLGITEFLPWDVVIVRDMLRELPILGDGGQVLQCGFAHDRCRHKAVKTAVGPLLPSEVDPGNVRHVPECAVADQLAK